MAEQKEIFNILKDGVGDGEAPDRRALNESVNNAVSLVAYSGRSPTDEVKLINVQDENNPASIESATALTVKDEDGNIQYIPMNNGAIVVTSEGQGNLLRSMNSGTVGTAGTFSSAVILGLSLSKQYDDVEICISSFKDCTWKLWYIDDAGGPGEALTDIEYFRTGAGQYTFKTVLSNYRLDTSAGTGVQQLALEVKQRSGTGSDFNASIAVIERNP